MTVTEAFFETLEPGAVPGFVLRLHVIGEDFQRRAQPLLARVGDVHVQRIVIAPGGAGFSGWLATEPNPGDRLFVRYADRPESSTGVVFGPFPNA